MIRLSRVIAYSIITIRNGVAGAEDLLARVERDRVIPMPQSADKVEDMVGTPGLRMHGKVLVTGKRMVAAARFILRHARSTALKELPDDTL